MTEKTNESTRLMLQIATLQSQIETLKSQIDDAENSYESLYDQHEQLECQTQAYVDNKQFFDNFIPYIIDIKEFFYYIKDDCEVTPTNEHIYRAFFHGMERVIHTVREV